MKPCDLYIPYFNVKNLDQVLLIEITVPISINSLFKFKNYKVQ